MGMELPRILKLSAMFLSVGWVVYFQMLVRRYLRMLMLDMNLQRRLLQLFVQLLLLLLLHPKIWIRKYIMKENFAMTLEIKFKADENVKEQHIYSGQFNPSSLKGFHGLYMFPLKKKSPKPFQTAGIYLFRFSLVFSVACRDRFCNRILLKPQTEIEMKLNSGGTAISSECNYDQYITECSYDQYITHDKYTMKFKKLGDDICRYGLCIRQCDANVVSLNIKQSNIELEMSNLGACIGLDSFHDLVYDKDMIMEKIEGKADSAAAVIYKLLGSPKPEQLYLKYAHDILGVVALLGEVRTHKLSSMLSSHLGEDQLVAVVCKSRAAPELLTIIKWIEM